MLLEDINEFEIIIRNMNPKTMYFILVLHTLGCLILFIVYLSYFF